MSFVLLAHNQERFVGEAVAAALAQTYEPLEVVLSDDASSDASFQILSEAAAAHRGPHRVVLNRNPRNLGAAAHTSCAAALASGSLLVLAHGDDVSHRGRTADCAAAFAARPELAAVMTRSPLIDADGKPITSFTRQGSLYLEAPVASHEACTARFARTFRPSLLGGATTWRRDLFDRFGPIDPGVRAEDLVLSFRALLAGEVAALDEPGIHYRIHGANLSLTDGQSPASWARARFSEEARVTWLRVQQSLYPQMAQDLRCAAGLGLVDFDPAPHLAWMAKRTAILALLAAQPRRNLPGRSLIAARVLARRPGLEAARAALLRVLPERAVTALRRLKP